jgi:hypothetical protein
MQLMANLTLKIILIIINFAAQLALDLYNDESLTLNDENRGARLVIIFETLVSKSKDDI